MIKEVVTFIVQQLVSQQEVVEVTVIKKGETSLLEIKIAQEDRGRVIGKEGQTIKAIRSLVDVIIPKGKKVSLELVR